MRRLSHLDIDESSSGHARAIDPAAAAGAASAAAPSPPAAAGPGHPATPATARYPMEPARSFRGSAGRLSSARTPVVTVPGRPRLRRIRDAAGTGPSSSPRHPLALGRRLLARWCRPLARSGARAGLWLAVAFWYALGVVSIGSSKILLTPRPSGGGSDHVGGVPPLFLTLQQLLIGSTLLRTLLRLRLFGSAGVRPWPEQSTAAVSSYSPRHLQSPIKRPSSLALFDPHPSLVFAAVYFTLGFLATNCGFAGSSAAFVETIKASEPITSASVAVWSGIETVGRREAGSLLLIVLGVLLSTLGNHHVPHNADPATATAPSSLSDSVLAALVVLASNLCFSFRGLHQKRLRATPEGSPAALDDPNLQFRMQQLGAALLAVPVLLWDGPGLLRVLWRALCHDGLLRSGLLARYLALAGVNGCAFTGYNLASTYLLTRISVVHHAALNCIRRIFAIVVTSIFFGIPVTLMGVVGITCSIGGFMAFTHYKQERLSRPKQLSSLLPVSALQHNHDS